MAEESTGETPELVVARKYGSPETKKVEEKGEVSLAERTLEFLDSNLTDPKGKEVYKRIEENREIEPEASLFHLIQEELRDLEHKPQTELESTLRRARQILINDAKEHGIFDGLRITLQEAQATNDFERAMGVINKINIRHAEDEAHIYRGWTQDFGGMLDEYKDVALLNMRIAELRASGLGDSTQAKGLERKIDLRGWGQPPQGLESMALSHLMQQERKVGREEARPEMPAPPGEAGTQDVLGTLAEIFEKDDPEVEKKRWIDMEYRQDFFERFDPRTEPRFYKKLVGKERRLWDNRWQLARAAYIKKVQTAFPDKYRENGELSGMGKEKMEALYEMPGVKPMLEAYARAIVKHETIRLPDGKEMSFWDIKDESDFEEYRRQLSRQTLSPEGIEESVFKEVDAVAWNLIFVGNLVESANSRYSYAGQLYWKIPGALDSLEYRTVFHPQERFEGKCFLGHEGYSPLAGWGVHHVGKIKKKYKFDSAIDEYTFVPAKAPREYWEGRRTKLPVTDPEKLEEAKRKKKKGRVIEIRAPEAYPVTTTKSFWEETKAKGKTLLKYLEDEEEVPWKDVAADAWVIYMTGKFHKAVALNEYYIPERPMELDRIGFAKAWAGKMNELLVRLKPEKELRRLRKNKITFQTIGSLKAWAVYAGLGGVKKVGRRTPTLNLPMVDRAALQSAFKGKNIGFFEKGKMLGILKRGDSLKIR